MATGPLPHPTDADWRELLDAACACIRSRYASRYRDDLHRAALKLAWLDATPRKPRGKPAHKLPPP